MKRKVFLSLLLILAILLVSCEIKNDSLGTNSDEKVVVIDFLEQSGPSRGMTQFPENIPFYTTSNEHVQPFTLSYISCTHYRT